MPDTVAPLPEREPEPEIPSTPGELEAYLDSLPDAELYRGGVLNPMLREVPEYARRILSSPHDRFIVVDKARMMVLLYDRYGRQLKGYDMACAKNFGNKRKKADSRTPEGFFSVEGVYNSTDWLFTDDDGVTSQKKGQFGPRFIRLNIPTTSQIGIHGTCAPWSMGHRSSHGCIRILNENILELVDLVEPGMPVIVLPGKRDRAVNREEGKTTPYFPTDPKYAMSEAERGLRPRTQAEIEEAERRAEQESQRRDSIEAASEAAAEKLETTDSVANPDTNRMQKPEPEGDASNQYF